MRHLQLLSSADLQPPVRERSQDSPEYEDGKAEKRSERRFAVPGEAEIVVKDGSSLFHGRILNITMSGCYVQTREFVHLAPQSPVHILFVLNGKIVSVAAEARFSSPRAGIGFRFVDAHHAMQAILDAMLTPPYGELPVGV